MATDEQRDQLQQAENILAGQDIGSYTLTEDDVNGCKGILARLIADDHLTGGYRISNVQGYQGKASVVIEFAKRVDAMHSGEVAARTADSSDKLGLLCKKVIAHYATNGDRLEKLEEHYAASEQFFNDSFTSDGKAASERLRAARDNLR